MADEKKPDVPCDVIAVGETLPNGDISFVRQRQDETGTTIEGGTLRVLPDVPEAAPDDVEEVVRMSHLTGNLFQVNEVVHKGGPAMVNNSAFRNNWETIFGSKQTVGQA